MVFSPRFNLRAKAFFQMQGSWEKNPWADDGSVSSECPLGNAAEVCHCQATGGPQWSPAATMNVVRAEE